MAYISRRMPTFDAIPRALTRDSSISVSSRFLYAVLWSFTTGDDRSAFPLQTELCDIMHATGPTLRKAIKGLVDSGWISVYRCNEDPNSEDWKRKCYVLEPSPIPVEERKVSQLKINGDNLPESQLKINGDTTTKEDIKKPRFEKLEDSSFQSWFSSFRSAYPKRANNPWSTAERAASVLWLLKGKSRPDFDVILVKIIEYAEYIEKSKAPVAHATTWLNQRRWECDFDVPSESGKFVPPEREGYVWDEGEQKYYKRGSYKKPVTSGS